MIGLVSRASDIEPGRAPRRSALDNSNRDNTQLSNFTITVIVKSLIRGVLACEHIGHSWNDRMRSAAAIAATSQPGGGDETVVRERGSTHGRALGRRGRAGGRARHRSSLAARRVRSGSALLRAAAHRDGRGVRLDDRRSLASRRMRRRRRDDGSPGGARRRPDPAADRCAVCRGGGDGEGDRVPSRAREQQRRRRDREVARCGRRRALGAAHPARLERRRRERESFRS